MAEKVEQAAENEAVTEAQAVARYVRITPRKARLVIDLIRGQKSGRGLAILRHTPRAASPMMEKVLNSAVANAEHNYNMDPTNCMSRKIYVDEGPTLKRYRPRARGVASRINKRTSHITVVLKEE